jgi:hypothetical protein
MIAFNPTGALLSFTAAVVPPTSVQALSLNGVQCPQVCLTNADGAIDCVVGWGATDAAAKYAALNPTISLNSYYLLARSQVVVTTGDDMFFSGATASATAAIKVQSGLGI